MNEAKPLLCGCNLKALNDIIQPNTVNQQIISLLSTVLERCKKEKERNCLQLPLEDYYERVSYYTAYSTTFIHYMIEGNNFKEQVLDIYDHILLMELVNNIYVDRKLFKFKNLYDEFTNFKSSKPDKYKITCIKDSKTFDLKLLTWGYGLKKTAHNPPILLENPKYKFDRYNYFYKLKNYREKGCKIYYVDDKIIHRDSIKKVPNYIEDKSTFSTILFHLISDSGLENSLFVSHSSDKSFEEIFKKWMLDIVLHSIKPSSVIVMENSALHGLFPKKTITRYHTKKDMLKWLEENDIPCDISMAKAHLYDLIEKCTNTSEGYDIDRIFKANGHEVLRLPETFPSLTPSTFLWEFLCNQYKPKEVSSDLVKENIMQKISKITPIAWKNFTERVIELEEDIYKFDAIAEVLIDTFELDENTL